MSFSCLFPRTKRKWTATLNTLAKYYEGKYHNSVEYQRLMGTAKRLKRLIFYLLWGLTPTKNTAKAYKRTSLVKQHLPAFGWNPLLLHFIDRLIGQTSEPHPGKRLGVSVEDALDALINPVSVSDVRTLTDGSKRPTFTEKSRCCYQYYW